MSQHTARHDPRAKSGDEDDGDLQARQPGAGPYQPVGQRIGQRIGQPADDGGASPDEPGEPDEGEFELIGDDDLGAADLGPAAPNFTDPDAPSGRMRK
jgi:hypothetical protein